MPRTKISEIKLPSDQHPLTINIQFKKEFGGLIKQYLNDPLNKSDQDVVKDNSISKKSDRSRAYQLLTQFINEQLGQDEYIIYDQVVNYISKQ